MATFYTLISQDMAWRDLYYLCRQKLPSVCLVPSLRHRSNASSASNAHYDTSKWNIGVQNSDRLQQLATHTLRKECLSEDNNTSLLDLSRSTERVSHIRQPAIILPCIGRYQRVSYLMLEVISEAQILILADAKRLYPHLNQGDLPPNERSSYYVTKESSSSRHHLLLSQVRMNDSHLDWLEDSYPPNFLNVLVLTASIICKFNKLMQTTFSANLPKGGLTPPHRDESR